MCPRGGDQGYAADKLLQRHSPPENCASTLRPPLALAAAEHSQSYQTPGASMLYLRSLSYWEGASVYDVHKRRGSKK